MTYRVTRLLGSGGFEPSKAEPTDLQSAPFDHSGNSPELIFELYKISSFLARGLPEKSVNYQKNHDELPRQMRAL